MHAVDSDIGNRMEIIATVGHACKVSVTRGGIVGTIAPGVPPFLALPPKKTLPFHWNAPHWAPKACIE